LLQRLAIAFAGWLTRTDYAALSPATLIRQLPCPVMLIESGNDPFLAPPDRAALQAAISAHAGPAKIWTAQDVEHLMALSADPTSYRQQISTFLADARVCANTSSSQMV
jgi:dienelactone hydrolase